MQKDVPDHLVKLDLNAPIWEQFFTVAPLVLVGTMEEDGSHDLAPKHMAMPLGWDNYYCFVCTPSHATYRNIKRDGEFTVSYPRPAQLLQTSLAAAPRMEDRSKPSLSALPVFPARQVKGVLVKDCYLYLECELREILDGFSKNSLIIGNIVAAACDEQALRRQDADDNELLHDNPLIAYLQPGRLSEISRTNAFPFPAGFCR